MNGTTLLPCETVISSRAPCADVAPRRVTRLLSGSLDEVNPPALLQFVGLLGLRDLCVTLRSPAAPSGHVWLDRSEVLHARVGALAGLPALRRLFARGQGTFRVFHAPCPAAATIHASVEKCLLDGTLFVDLHRELAAAGRLLVVRDERLRDVQADEAGERVLDAVRRERELDAILAACPYDELETLDFLARLFHEGAVTGSD